ncbi:MAG: ATP-dependent sacrificial sulfur transferase LarE [Candidatus Omnitrophota bacterium]
MDKLRKLQSILKNMGSVLIAYSGGVDSTFLLKVAQDCLGENVLAVTADSPTYPKEELNSAIMLAKEIGARHKIIATLETKNINFILNPPNRCYFCKKELFSKLWGIAKEFKLNFICDATNVSDESDFRPGARARKELKVRSPLEEAGLTKAEIRSFSKKLKLKTWDKPALACLASRIPYGIKIRPKVLQRVALAEAQIRRLGFKQVRVRHYNGLCRIEVDKKEIPILIKESNSVVEKLRGLGYNYVTVDLEGYRTGSLNLARRK